MMTPRPAISFPALIPMNCVILMRPRDGGCVEVIQGVFPVRHTEVQRKLAAALSLFLPLLPPPPFFFLSALEPNGNSPGDSFLSVKDEKQARKRGGVVRRTRQADMRDSEVTGRNMGGR